MSEKETTSTTRIFKSCLDIVKGFSKQNNISDSQQISIIVETYKHLAPANTRMDGFIYDHFIKEDQEEKRFTYETLYNLYKYAINKNSNLKDYYYFSATLSKIFIVTQYVETHMEIDDDYDGGPRVVSSKETIRFLTGEKYEEFSTIGEELIKSAKAAYKNDIYGKNLDDHIYMICATNQNLQILFMDEFIINREQSLYECLKNMSDDFPRQGSCPYASFTDYFGVKDRIKVVLMDYYQNPNSFLISNSITESFICDLLDILHIQVGNSKKEVYSKSVVSALKIAKEVAKLEKFKESYTGYFKSKLESKNSNLLDAIQEDIEMFDKDVVSNHTLAEFSLRVPKQLCYQTLANNCNFLEFSNIRQVVNSDFLNIFWPALKYIIEKDKLPLLLNPNSIIEYGGNKNFISEYDFFTGCYIEEKDNPFVIKITEQNRARLQCSISYKKDNTDIDFDIDFEILDKLQSIITSNQNSFGNIFNSSTGSSIKIANNGSMCFYSKALSICIDKNIAHKFYEVIDILKKSKQYEDILIVNRLHNGQI